MSDPMTREQFKSQLVLQLTADIARLEDTDQKLRRLEGRGQAILQEGKSLLEAVSKFDFGTEDNEHVLPDEVLNRIDTWFDPIRDEINGIISLAEEIFQLQADIRKERSKRSVLSERPTRTRSALYPYKLVRVMNGARRPSYALEGPPIKNENG